MFLEGLNELWAVLGRPMIVFVVAVSPFFIMLRRSNGPVIVCFFVLGSDYKFPSSSVV